MASLNHTLFLTLNASSEPPWPVVAFAVFAAKYLVLLVPLHIGLVWLTGSRDMRAVALTGAVALALALGINQVIGLVVYTPRPFLIGLGHTLIDHRPSSSFPSNHATVFLAYGAALALCGARGLALVVAGLGLLVAWSRVYLGIHFPLDMAGAAVVSVSGAFISVQGMRRWGGRILDLAERRLSFPSGQRLR